MLPIKDLFSLLTLTRRDITTVAIFAVAIGMLSLVVPIAAQGLVTIVSFGSLRQPLFVLAIVVFVLLVFSGIARVLQNILVEIIQQRLFASVAFKIADRLPRIDMAVLDNRHGTELLNNFFDVMTLQKTLAAILINVSAFLLQALLGMLLLAMYHPALIAFDVVFIAILAMIIIIPYSRGLETALNESNMKYKVVGWLEEMARVPLLFHFQNHGEFGVEKADDIISKYLKARQAHFKILIQHMIGAYGLQTLASTSLFVIGGLLVLKNQMTLGQLVAAEIVITSLGSNAANIARYLEKIYDLKAAAEKVNVLMMFPTEHGKSEAYPIHSHLTSFKEPPIVAVKALMLPGQSGGDNKISFTIHPGAAVAVVLDRKIGRSLLLDSILGLRSDYSGEILFNNIPLNNYPLTEFRKKISYIRDADCFDGTILENIMVGNHGATLEKIMALVDAFGISGIISSLPQGLQYPLTGTCRPFTQAQLRKLVFIREILNQPFLMAIDEAFDLFSLEEVKTILHAVHQHCTQLTMIVTTRREDVAQIFDQRIDL